MNKQKIKDCEGYGCGECDICLYLDFLEFCESVGAKQQGFNIQRNKLIDKYLQKYENKF